MTTIDAAERFAQGRKPPRPIDDRAGLERVRQHPDARKSHDRWAVGQTVPCRITLALDIARLEGPEVDAALGVEEPAVDRWERGTLYPTWDQLCALAILTDFPVAFFTEPAETTVIETDIRLRPTGGKYAYRREPRPVLTFTPRAITRTLGTAHICPTCRKPR